MKTSEHYLFYASTPPSDGVLCLDPVESHHALNVLRLQTNDTIQVTNGNGSMYDCLIKGIDSKKLYAQISGSRFCKRPYSIHLMIGLPDKDAFETVITECTALGVSRITPLIASHCQKPWWKHSWEKHKERFTLKMTVSMKQSLFPWLPTLDEPLSVKESLSLCRVPILVADPDGDPIISVCQNIPCSEIICYIGPPGGFSTDELEILIKSNAMKATIGVPRFRTELASVVLCAQLIAINQTNKC
jgi:16S rRNA (uracil1498-N3)-methyltransferase